MGKLVSTYLRLPLGTSFRCMSIETQSRKNLKEGWLLGDDIFQREGGRVTLIKSTLLILLIYFMLVLSPMLWLVRMKLE